MMYEPGEASSRAVRYARRLGFQLATEPELDIPSLPADITSVSDQELMGLFTEITSWLDYVEVCVASAQIDEKQENQRLEEAEAKEQVRHKAERTVTVVKALVINDDVVISQRERSLSAFAKRKMLETVFNSLDRKRFVVSRELTRRRYGNES